LSSKIIPMALPSSAMMLMPDFFPFDPESADYENR
jgi:hypothetical protein